MEKGNKKEEKVKRAASGSKKQENHEYETMSQQQNRHGKGRQQNGTEGSRQARGSNH